MAIGRLTYTSSTTGRVYHLNDGRLASLVDEGIEGIYGIAGTPNIAAIPLQQPPAVYESHTFHAREITVHVALTGKGVRINPLSWWSEFMSDARADAMASTPGVLTYTNEAFVTRAIQATVSQDSDGLKPVGGFMANRGVFEAKLTFMCADPTFYDPVLKTKSGVFNGTANVNISCTNDGDVPAYPSILYATNAVNVLQLPECDWGSSYYYIVLGTVAVSQMLLTVADPSNWAITYSGSPSDWSGLRYGSLPIVAPGTNNLTFKAANAAANAAITVSWYDRYSFFH